MKMKFSNVLLATAMLCTVLNGCGQEKEPTAEDLLNSNFGVESIDSVDLGVKLTADMDIDAGSILGDSSGSTTMNCSVVCDINVKVKDDLTYTKGTTDVSIFGMSFNQNIENYQTTIDGVQYVFSYDEDNDIWTKSEEDASDDDITSTFSNEAISSINASVFDYYELQEVNKDDTEYVITGTISYDKLVNTLGFDLSDLTESFTSGEDVDFSGFKADVTLVYDRETKACKSMKYSFDASSMTSDEYTVNELSIEITINQINGVEVSIPDDVINSAVEESENDSDILETDTETTLEDDIVSEDYDIETGTLSEYLFGVSYVYSSEIKDFLSNYYTTLPSDTVISRLAVLCNQYDFDSFITYLGLYDYWDSDYRDALAIMCDIGIFDVDAISEYGIDTDDINSRIDSLSFLK